MIFVRNIQITSWRYLGANITIIARTLLSVKNTFSKNRQKRLSLRRIDFAGKRFALVCSKENLLRNLL